MSPTRTGFKQVTIYCPDDLHEAIRTKAFFERTSINKLVLAAVEESLKKSPAPKLPKAKKAAKR
jgi:predicted HicB family RNase H-like nuclease